jgi:hypothetical protein
VAFIFLLAWKVEKMEFKDNSEDIARSAMAELDWNLVDKYATVIRFLLINPGAASALRGTSAPCVGTEEYIRRQASAFANARRPKAPAKPNTVPDRMVSEVLVSYFKVPHSDTERIKIEHQLSMGAENMVGDLLERYLASVMEPIGWIWCSGAMVKAADFIKPPTKSGDAWRLLQVKNRNNSENSSSSAIRIGTIIEKWHRTNSNKPDTNWKNFPDESSRIKLSEEGFSRFVKGYLEAMQ